MPDIDLIIRHLRHRGPTHSIIVATLFFTPFFIIYKKKAIPYYIALAQHFLIGDLLMGGQVQLLWPLTTRLYGVGIRMAGPINITAEWLLFIASLVILLWSKQIIKLLKPQFHNLLLIIPTSTLILPILITFADYSPVVPIALTPPHIIYALLFSTSIIMVMIKPPKIFNKDKAR
jgi:membrane-bound metal-dependent hydrolase YbcI (DUF457 family)